MGEPYSAALQEYIEERMAEQEASEALVRPNMKRLIAQPLMNLQSDIVGVTDGHEHEAINAAFAKMHRKLDKILSAAQPRLL